MANSFTNVIPQILKQALPVLRQQSIMPRLINRDIANEPMERGNTVDIGIADAGTVRDVTPGVTTTAINVTGSKVTLNLNIWREAGHTVTDKDLSEVMNGYLPRQAEEDIKALVNDIDQKIMDEAYKSFYNFAGTTGTTPFAGAAPVTSLADFNTTRVQLNTGLAPMSNRSIVLDPAAEGSALIMSPFIKADERGDQGAILEGQIGRKLGVDWYMSQNVRTFTPGTLSNVTAVVTKIAYASGATTVAFDRATLTGTLKRGDLFTLAGNQYVITATATAGTNIITVAIDPPLKAAVASNITATFLAIHGATPTSQVNNLHFHRDAIAFASRPLISTFAGGNQIGSIVDPVSGLVLRAELSRQNKQTALMFDILCGVKCVRSALGSRILG